MLERLEILEVDEDRPISTWAISVTFSTKVGVDDDGSFPADAGFSFDSLFLIGCDLI